MTQKQLDSMMDNLEQYRAMLKKHYGTIESEQSLYNVHAMSVIGAALDGINDAIEALQPKFEVVHVFK
jgi:hypothetical protein